MLVLSVERRHNFKSWPLHTSSFNSPSLLIHSVTHLTRHLRPEQEPRPARWHRPATNILRVRPHEITVGSLVGHLLHTLQHLDLVQWTDGRREPSMHTQHFAIHHCGQIQIIEHLNTVLPRIGITVFAHTFFIEAIHLGDLTWLVVAAQQRNVSRVSIGEGLTETANTQNKTTYANTYRNNIWWTTSIQVQC